MLAAADFASCKSIFSYAVKLENLLRQNFIFRPVLSPFSTMLIFIRVRDRISC